MLTFRVLYRNYGVFRLVIIGAYGHRAWPSTKGFAKGFTKGFAKGVIKGFAKGFIKGFAKGFAKGFTKGFAKGLLISYVPRPDYGNFEWSIVKVYRHLVFP